MIASFSKLPVTDSAMTMSVCTAIDTNGVLNRACTIANGTGMNPSRPNANSIRGAASVMPLMYPNIDRVDPTRMSRRPLSPITTVAASANGVFWPTSDAPRMPCVTSWTERYSTVAPIIARKIARGTVRDGSCTSPLGTNADSTPRNAKISTADARATSRVAGVAVHRRFSVCTPLAPTTTSAMSGSSLATVITALNRLAPRTPTTLSAARATRIATSVTDRADPLASAGISAPSASAKNDDTAAVAAVIPAQSMTPDKKPTSGPNATSTYAYNPPVSETRLPASAKHSTMRPMATAQTTYASGAAVPSASATPVGRRKMPAPIVTLTMLAARPHTPTARTSDAWPRFRGAG